MSSFSKEPSGSFSCPVYSTDTLDLGLKYHPNDMVQRGIELKTPGLTKGTLSPSTKPQITGGTWLALVSAVQCI